MTQWIGVHNTLTHHYATVYQPKTCARASSVSWGETGFLTWVVIRSRHACLITSYASLIVPNMKVRTSLKRFSTLSLPLVWMYYHPMEERVSMNIIIVIPFINSDHIQ